MKTFTPSSHRLCVCAVGKPSRPKRRGGGERTTYQITFATDRGYAILTYNSSDFPRLHYEIVTSGRVHTGIILATRENPRRNIRALFNLLKTLSAEAISSQLVYLNNWA